ncbi:hypothetical protein [Chitinimonas lacunae]|uniref:Uncharacterized protein n=1 Tax=Chitinimonas lacunae TaxID=1963018 RepID=A0ABV8MNY2_9NEIS
MANDLQNIIYTEIQKAVGPIAAQLKFNNLLPFSESTVGDFPWFWENGSDFNASTFQWLNKRLRYNNDGYAETDGSLLNTDLYNVMQVIQYQLDSAEESKLNEAILANAPIINTLIRQWVSLEGALPPDADTMRKQLDYITAGILSWGPEGLTLQQLRNSIDPMALLPNIPVGGDLVVSTLMTYLQKTDSVAGIQNSLSSFNNQIKQVVRNFTATTLKPGFMQTVDSSGKKKVEIEMRVLESVAAIQNELLPKQGGRSFSASFQASKLDAETVSLSVQGGASGSGRLGFLFGFNAQAGASYNMFSADSSLTECDIELTFNGVTAITPQFTAFDINSLTGWWYPLPIADAANPRSDESGYRFTLKPMYDFAVKGNFGALGRLLISQQPVITLRYHTSNYQAFQETFKQDASWGISFLGIKLAGGSESYYRSTTSYDSQSQTVTVTMSPAGINAPLSPTDQLANVIGVQVVWPGATQKQNLAHF